MWPIVVAAPRQEESRAVRRLMDRDDLRLLPRDRADLMRARFGAPMKALILDGWHRGSVHNIPEPFPVFHLTKPRGITTCDCDPEVTTRVDREAQNKTYKLAAISRDRTTALYSEHGDLFDPLTKYSTWIVKDSTSKPMPNIYYNCRDERAF